MTATDGHGMGTIADVTEPTNRLPVIPYEPVEVSEPSLARRAAVRSWFPFYSLMLVSSGWRFLVRLGHGEQLDELLADPFVAWIVLGICVALFGSFHKPR